MIDGPSTRYHRVTKPAFRPCSTCRSRSQAPLRLYTPRTMSNRAEGTFGRLRYFLGGDRPSQTARLTGSRTLVSVRPQVPPGWYPTVGSTHAKAHASLPPTYPVQGTPQASVRVQSSSTGSFCPVAGTLYLHRDCNFTGSLVETAPKSLHHSCGSELTRQGISLP